MENQKENQNGNEREIRLSIDDFETLLRNDKVIESNETVYRAWIEPGELVIKVVK